MKLDEAANSRYRLVKHIEFAPLLTRISLKYFDTLKCDSRVQDDPVKKVEHEKDVDCFKHPMTAPNFRDLPDLAAERDSTHDESEAYARKIEEVVKGIALKRFRGIRNLSCIWMVLWIKGWKLFGILLVKSPLANKV
jgi:hypothetical protein